MSFCSLKYENCAVIYALHNSIQMPKKIQKVAKSAARKVLAEKRSISIFFFLVLCK